MFSIITPTLNSERFLAQALLSVNTQTGASFEHVVQDGGSTDGTQAILQASPNPVDWVSAKDNGQSDALNKALARSRGDWIGWLNADETYLPGTFESVARFIEVHPQVDVVFGDCLFVDPSGHPIRLRPAHRFSKFVLRHYGCYINTCSMFIRRDALEGSALNPSLERAMDWDLLLTLSRQSSFGYLPRTLATFAVHPDQVTALRIDGGDSELRRIRRAHGIEDTLVSRKLARMVHIGLKALNGAYVKQFREVGGPLRRRFRAERSFIP